LALFLTPTAFASDDDDLPPLIPSKNIDDLDDLPPLIPKNPPGKEPPTEPPIEIEVPDDGEDLDLDLNEGDIKKLLEGSVWTIMINDTSYGTFEDDPQTIFTIKMGFVADKSGGEDMFGTYKARSAFVWIAEHEFEGQIATQSQLFESDNFTIELQPYDKDDDPQPQVPPKDNDDDDIAPLVLSKNNDDYGIAHLLSSKNSDDDDLGTLVPVPLKAQWVGSMAMMVTVLGDVYDALTEVGPYDYKVGIYAYGNGNVKMNLALDIEYEFFGRLSRSIDGRGLS